MSRTPNKETIAVAAAIVSAPCAVICIFFLWQSRQASRDAITIAKEALEHSKKAFLAVNRAYLVAEPLRFEDTETYFKTEVQEQCVVVRLRYQLINTGSLPMDQESRICRKQ